MDSQIDINAYLNCTYTEMGKKKIILAGSNTALSSVLTNFHQYTNLELVAVLTNSKDALPEEYQKKFYSLLEYNGLSKNLKPDWLLHLDSPTVFAPEFLEQFKCGALNAYPGILPDYAGMFPYQWAVRNDELECGATLHWITAEPDSGPIALQETFKISDEDTGYTIYSQAHFACITLVQKALKLIDKDSKLPIIPQDKFKRKYYAKEDAAASEIDWSSSARKVFNFIRAGNFNPLPSPSYTAKTHFKLTSFTLQKVRLGERALGMAGMVCSLKDGIHVVCGDGVTVIISEGTETPPLKVGDILG